MKDVNACVLSGRLTHSPEKGPEGGPTCKFSFANNVGYGDRERVQFINVSVWGKSGENCLEYLKSKQGVTVTGEVFMRKYKTQAGEDRCSQDMNATDVVFGAKAKDNEQPEQEAPPVAGDDSPPF